MQVARRLALASFVLALQACASAPPAAPAAPNAVPAALREAHEGYVNGWNAEDVAALAQYFAEDARVQTPNGVFSGRQQIAADWLSGGLPAITLVDIAPDSFTVGSAEITETGRYTLTTGNGTESGRYTIVWARQADGRWRVRSQTVAGG